MALRPPQTAPRWPATTCGMMLVILLAAAHCATAARVLVHPFPWASRAFDLVALSTELASRGHEVLVMMPWELSGKVGSMILRERLPGGDHAGSVQLLEYETIPMETLRDLEHAGIFELVSRINEYLFRGCAFVFGNQTALDSLYDFNADIAIGDSLTSCFWITTDILGVPRIDYNSGAGGVSIETTVYRLDTTSLAYIPMYSSGLPPTGMNLAQRTANALILGVLQAAGHLMPYPTHEDMRRAVNTTWRNQHVPKPNRHRAMLTISGVDVGVELPRPLQPFVKYVGPLLAAPSHPLPPDLEEFVAGAGPPGVILAAFGSMMNVQPHALMALSKVFASLPQRVVWKVSDIDLSEDTRRGFDAVVAAAGNIRVQQWLPQQDLLGHPAVKLFLSHGGIHSMYESLWHSTPMVLMPIATDQFDNSRLVADYHGAGIMVDRTKLDKGDTSHILAALQEVLQNPRYEQRAGVLAKRLRSQPGTPRSRAAEWVEYALATGPEPFLWSHEIHMPWWQRQYLDVAALAAATLAAGIAAVRWCLRARRLPQRGLAAQVKHVKGA